MDWRVNPGWKDQPAVRVGDTIHLKPKDIFEYRVRAIALDIQPSHITARVKSIFDWPGSAGIKIETIKKVVGEVVRVTPEHIHQVIQSGHDLPEPVEK